MNRRADTGKVGSLEEMRHALTQIAEWAETADAHEAVEGLPQTASIARRALQSGGSASVISDGSPTHCEV